MCETVVNIFISSGQLLLDLLYWGFSGLVSKIVVQTVKDKGNVNVCLQLGITLTANLSFKFT